MKDVTLLPSNWILLTVQDATEVISLTDIKIKKGDYQEKGPLPVIDQGRELIGGYTDKEWKKVKCSPPVIVFGDHTKILKYVDFPFAPGADGIKVLKPHPFYNEKLFYYFLKSINLPDKGYSRHFQYLEKSNIPLPPLGEQRRIVSRIEQLFTQIDEGVRYLQQAQTQLEQCKQATLQASFNGIEEKTLLRELLKEPLKNGKSAKTVDGWSGIPIIKLTAVTEKDFSQKNIKMSDLQKKEVADLWVKKEDIFIERSNTPDLVGSSAIYLGEEDRFVFPDLLIRVRVNNERVLPKYVAYYLDSKEARSYFKNKAKGTSNSMPKISQGPIEAIKIPVPSIPNQIKIVTQIEELELSIQFIQNQVSSGLHFSQFLKQSILKSAFSGSLVSQNPNDEPASVLLERIKTERGSGKLSRGQRRLS